MGIVAAHLPKLLEDCRLFSRRNTDSCVADRDLCAIISFVSADADSPSLGCELHGIGKKVEKNLFDLSLVADVFPEPVVHINVQGNAVLDSALSNKGACVVYRQGEIKRS